MEAKEKLKQFYNQALVDGLVNSKTEFAELLETTKGTLSSCLSGKPRFEGACNNLISKAEKIIKLNSDEIEINSKNFLPLVPIDAVAGFNGIDVPGVSFDECQKYYVPEFVAAGAQYLIRVSGQSMVPTYNNGDILVCKFIREATFIQWGKVYVFDSEQGAMVKRIYPDELHQDRVICKSDNPNYPPFSLPYEQIRSLSIVIGLIRLE